MSIRNVTFPLSSLGQWSDKYPKHPRLKLVTVTRVIKNNNNNNPQSPAPWEDPSPDNSWSGYLFVRIQVVVGCLGTMSGRLKKLSHRRRGRTHGPSMVESWGIGTWWRNPVVLDESRGRSPGDSNPRTTWHSRFPTGQSVLCEFTSFRVSDTSSSAWHMCEVTLSFSHRDPPLLSVHPDLLSVRGQGVPSTGMKLLKYSWLLIILHLFNKFISILSLPLFFIHLRFIMIKRWVIFRVYRSFKRTQPTVYWYGSNT